MIGAINGILVEKSAPNILVEAYGVGYEIEVPLSSFFKLPELQQPVRLRTHLAIRDDAHTLFGFVTDEERDLFRSLIKVNGVGAKVALGILSGISVPDFSLCVQDNNVYALTRLPGIGKKTAERLIIEMRDRLPDVDSATTVSDQGMAPRPVSAREEAISALVALGYKPQDASRMADRADQDEANSEQILRAALQATLKG